MPYTGMMYITQEERMFPAAEIPCAMGLRKKRLVVTFELIDEVRIFNLLFFVSISR